MKKRISKGGELRRFIFQSFIDLLISHFYGFNFVFLFFCERENGFKFTLREIKNEKENDNVNKFVGIRNINIL